MDISAFIKETLIALRSGIQDANKVAGNNPFGMMHGDKIDFDVAVTVSEKTEEKGGAKIGVAQIVSLGGDIAAENQSARTSRIKFSIKINHNLFGSAN